MKPMIRLVVMSIAIFLLAPRLTAQTGPFERFFLDQTMRVDFYHTGDNRTEFVTIDRIYQYGMWASSHKNLIDRFDNGQYYLKVYDATTGELIYSRGYDAYFYEYQTSADAREGIKRTYHETALLPTPRQPVRFVLEKRNPRNQLKEIFSTVIDPADVMIVRESPKDAAVIVVQSQTGSEPSRSVDIAFIGEGYTHSETGKFVTDLQRFTELFFKREPYKSSRGKFNIYGVLKPSAESGVDEPRHGKFKTTALNATFNSLGSERYLLTEDNRTLRNVAAHVPYDALYIMVNHHRYGGGGIYNLYCTFTVDNQWSEYLFTHEFGHSLLGLADEYYTSSVAYTDFYPKGVEPNAPNVTALLDPQQLKWKHLVEKDTPLPTLWDKAAFDKMDLAWQQQRQALNDQIATLNRSRAPLAQIREAEARNNRMDREHAGKVAAFLAKRKHAGKVGAFEGAGYASEGLYRPMADCIMFTKSADHFCTVCQAAIRGIIDYYTE